MTRATYALFFKAPTSNNHNNNNILFNFFKKKFFRILKMCIITYQKFKTIYFFFPKKKTFLKIGMKNGESYQTTFNILKTFNLVGISLILIFGYILEVSFFINFVDNLLLIILKVYYFLLQLIENSEANKFSFSSPVLGNCAKGIDLKRGIRYTASVSITCKELILWPRRDWLKTWIAT